MAKRELAAEQLGFRLSISELIPRIITNFHYSITLRCHKKYLVFTTQPQTNIYYIRELFRISRQIY
jgi:hypothetical protein